MQRSESELQRTPPALHTAVYEVKLATVKRLLNQGLNVDEDYFGETPLIWAVKAGTTSIIEELLESGANANWNNNPDKKTPLHHAAERKMTSIVQLLLDYGAEVNVVSK